MNEQPLKTENNESEQPEEHENSEGKMTKPLLKQPGIIASLVMIFLAAILLIAWVIDNNKVEQPETTPGIVAQPTLVEPIIHQDAEPEPTLVPQQTIEAVITANRQRRNPASRSYAYYPGR